ncbi:hypothetical protein ACIQXQ_11845 [Peribacillus sp. NPDC097198]|uniref:hypothetical protein n=1 Tax=Peribacillus sp. NPDC097198 TaxID=3364397 RepID=UPI0037F26137
MKKWIIILVVIIAIGTYFAWSKAHLEEPVVTSVQFDEAAKTLAVSYIVEQDDSTYVMEIAHDTKGFYPDSSNGKGNRENNTQVLATQDGYELREDIVDLTDDQLAYFLSLEGRAVSVDISFKDYSPIQTILAILLKDEAAEVTKQGDALLYTFTAPEDITIESIGHHDSEALISFDEIEFPLVLKKGQSVDVQIEEPYKLSSDDELLMEITTTKNQSFTQHFRLTQSIPEGYLKQIVNEANEE